MKVLTVPKLIYIFNKTSIKIPIGMGWRWVRSEEDLIKCQFHLPEKDEQREGHQSKRTHKVKSESCVTATGLHRKHRGKEQ